MNLAEVIVAITVFLGACSGAAQMGASSAEAMSLGRQRGLVLEQIEQQFLAVAPVLRAGASTEGGSCAAAAIWMRAQLEQGLPPLAPGLQRQLNLEASGQQLQLVFEHRSGLQRQRLLNPAALGLCEPDEPLYPEPSDAAAL